MLCRYRRRVFRGAQELFHGCASPIALLLGRGLAGLTLLMTLSAGWVMAAPPAAPFSFSVTGDVPYSEQEEALFESMLEQINAEEVEFVVHVGDFKSGHSRCSDELYEQRLRLFSLSRHPFILVPGDNDWLDCRRLIAGSHDPEERLEKLRTIFYSDEGSLGRRKLPLSRQGGLQFGRYRENVQWKFGGVRFVTLNVAGGNNNFGNANDPAREYARRAAANAEWLTDAFERAGVEQALGVVVFIHADPRFERSRNRLPGSGYREFLDALARLAKGFGRPVLVAHGDGHVFRQDRPLRDDRSGTPVANVMRLETFGSPLVGWVRIRVDGKNKELFSIFPQPMEP